MKMDMQVKYTNKFPEISTAIPKQAATALYMVAEEIMTDAKQNYVPVVSGNLRGSGFVEQPKITPGKITVTLGFGGVAAPYAVTVHEYPKAVGQGKNKYLTRPINAAAPDIAKRVAAFIRNMKGMP